MLDKRYESIKPISITNDIWFYPTKKEFKFVVDVNGGVNPIQFKISLSKIRKALIKANPDYSKELGF